MKPAAVILAAGRSTRMGDGNKMLAEIAGKALVRIVGEAACASSAAPVIAVTGHQGEAVASELAGLEIDCRHNPDFAQGMAGSLAAGIAALPHDASHAIVLLGDMPGITAQMIERMIAMAQAAPDGSIIAASHGGKRGNPVLWPHSDFAALCAIKGDKGGRGMLDANEARVVLVELGEAAAFDVDTPQALERARHTHS
ncbi:MAG: nucleotidyltransferase family protein [Paracoccaceae bacterium]